MKKILLSFFLLVTALASAQQQNVLFEVSPCTFQDDESITITFEGSSIDESAWGVSNNELFLWAWSFDGNDENIQDSPTNGQWTNSNAANQLTYNSGDDTYSITFTPTSFYGRPTIGSIGFLVKAQDGSDTGNGEKKSQDTVLQVGESSFTVTRLAPTVNTFVSNIGDNITIQASNTCGSANYVLRANGSIIDTQNNTSSYSYTDNNINSNRAYELEVTQGPDVRTLSVTTVINPGGTNQALPSGLEDGINYDPNDDTRATLVLNAPLKDYVFVAGSFNNYQPDGNFAMKKDPSSSKFWLELTGLTPGQIETYQYWVVDENPLANSPTLVKTADPYSTLVLSPFDDPFIPANSYPNLPTYPAGQEFEVTVLETGQTPYNWQVNNFQKPKIEDLIVYEVLVRDFDSNRNFQDLIDRMDYFKNLNINAIHLMPIQEFEGNESWGYNPSYHMALDKFYGTGDKFKEFVDLCHQNGIAVILDQVLNHAFGRSPFVRMWMTDPDGNGFGDPSIENPYMNVNSRHSFNVGYDFSHTEELPNVPSASSNDDTNPIVNYYVERVIKHWVEEYRIDGFRWDLTKGFTQNCSGGDDSCTNSYQQDRVDILRSYADYAWSIDDTHYVIFEHLGTDNEERQWADYRIGEGKGIMMWGKMTNEYNQLTMGFASNANINRMGHESRGFAGKRLLGYPESHDEERLMYRNLQFGNSALSSHNVQNLNVALSRMSALGAASVLIPGPKMIWHFSSLGMENSIFTCSNGTVNTPADPTPGDCKLDTKPQPQWTNNWLADPNRAKIYNDWARFHQLKVDEPVFEGDYAISPFINDIRQRIYVFDGNLPTDELRNVVILCNFSVADLNIQADFPYTGDWYDLMDTDGNTVINVSNTAMNISIPAGQFRIFGNQPSVLSIDEQQPLEDFKLIPNPANTSFQVNLNISRLEIYDMTGKMIKDYNGEFNSTDSFDISELRSGMYIVRVSNNSNQTKTTKLVKL